MGKSLGILLLVIGGLILLGGLGMAETKEHTSTTCAEGPRGIPNDGICTGYQAEATVETSNPARGQTIGFGFLIIVVGTIAYSTSGSEE